MLSDSVWAEDPRGEAGTTTHTLGTRGGLEKPCVDILTG